MLEVERFVDDQDVFIQFSANNMYECLGSGTSDNKVNKEWDKPKH